MGGELFINMENQKPGRKLAIGIKTLLPENICPANYTDVHFKTISPEGTVFPWKLGKNGFWSLRICYIGYRRFERSDGSVVCMKFVNGTGISKYSLSEKCYFDELPYKAFIASVHSVEESVWMQEEAGKYSTSNAEPMNYWTSGVRDGTCESTDSFDKKKNQFKWGDNITTGITALTEANTNLRCKSGGVPMNCLVVMSQGPTSPQTLGDFDCDTTASIGGGFCYYDLWREV